MTLRWPTYFINLDRSADRRAHMEALLAERGLAAERVPARDKATLTAADWERVDRRQWLLRYKHEPTGAEIGCYLSHLDALRRFLGTRSSHAVILEDDIAIDPDFPALLERVAALDRPWDMIRFCAYVDRPARHILSLDAAHALVRFQRGPLGTQGYAISRRGAEKLLAHAFPVRFPVDKYVDRIWETGLDQYGILPAPIRESAAFRSEISRERSPAIKAGRRGRPLARAAASAMDRLRGWRHRRRLDG